MNKNFSSQKCLIMTKRSQFLALKADGQKKLLKIGIGKKVKQKGIKV